MPKIRLRDMLLAAGASMLALTTLSSAQVVELFQEIRGEQEFSGVMVARPLQKKDADARGLTAREHLLATENAIRELMGFDIVNYFPEVDEYLIRVPKGETESTVAGRLMGTGAFAYVEPDWIVFPLGCPTDPSFAQQWHHQSNRLQSCAAWDLETGDPSIVVAICDTGVRTGHTDLRAHRYEGFHVPTQKWESQGGPINDIQGHGTACTGSAAANGNNGVGVSGMGWSLGHRMMRVTDSTDGSASLSNLTLAARTAADRGDKVASVSYSGVNNSTVFSAGTYVRSKGALLVWAAGNSNVNLSGNREDDVIVVGASDQNDAKASFSNYGTLVDLFAPGVSILTTSNAGDTSYSSVSGTSFACPITAGLCGLIWSRNPTLTPQQVESILRSTCVDLGTAGVDGTFGYGRINSSAAINATQPGSPDTTPPSPPSSLSATAGYNQVTLSWTDSPELDVAGYRVYRSEVSGGPYTEVTSSLVAAGPYTNTGLVAGQTYYFVVAAQDQAGNLSGASPETSAVPIAPPAPQLLFADGFESGNLTAGGWVASSSSLVSATTAAAASGSFGARVSRNATLTKARSTAGFQSIQVKYTRRTAGYESSEFLRLEWWNGSAWTQLEATRNTAFGAVTFDLPSGASNIGAFQIRFRSSANRNDEYGDVDLVEIWGTPVP